MSTNTIITINRQYGSNGRKIGKMLSEKLGIKYYDRDLISLAAKKSGYTEQIFESADEKPSNSLLYSLAVGAYANKGWFFQGDNVFSSDKLFAIQAEVIEKVAEDPCVIVGRCADFLLRQKPNLLTVYTHAPIAFRMERIRKENPKLSEKELEHIINRTDKNRSSYYNYYTGRDWYRSDNYHLTIDTSHTGLDGAVSLIQNFIEIKK